MYRLFTQHPHSLGETYWQHGKFALLFGFNMLVAGIACIIHAFFPFIFQKTGSNMMLKMMQDFVARMPEVEDRVIVIAEAIEKKRQR